MSRGAVFAEGVGAGAGLILFVAALLLLSRSRVTAAALARLQEASRTGRSPFTGQPPGNFLDVCRCAGL